MCMCMVRGLRPHTCAQPTRDYARKLHATCTSDGTETFTVPIDRITSSDQGSVDPVHGPPCQDGSPCHVSLREFGEAIEHPLREALHRTMARVRLQD